MSLTQPPRALAVLPQHLLHCPRPSVSFDFFFVVLPLLTCVFKHHLHLCCPSVHVTCHRWHLHQSRGRLGARVSRGKQPLVVIIGSVSTYLLLWLMTPVPVIVCRHLPPSAPSADVPVTSTYACVFWTLLPPSI